MIRPSERRKTLTLLNVIFVMIFSDFFFGWLIRKFFFN